MSAVIFGESGSDSDYVESAENSPTSPANTLDLTGHVSKMEAIHEVLEGELDAITRPTVLFSHTNELEIPDLADAETDPPKNHQDNSATPPVNTQSSPPHSPPEDTLVSSSDPSPRPHVEAGNSDLQACKGYLPDVRLLGTNYLVYEVYQYWVHQNTL